MLGNVLLCKYNSSIGILTTCQYANYNRIYYHINTNCISMLISYLVYQCDFSIRIGILLTYLFCIIMLIVRILITKLYCIILLIIIVSISIPIRFIYHNYKCISISYYYANDNRIFNIIILMILLCSYYINFISILI